MEEWAIIRAVLDGDRDAFALLISPYLPLWIRMATSWLGNASDAEDAVQDALIQCYQNLGQFRQSARFCTWATRIVIRECSRVSCSRMVSDTISDETKLAAVPGFDGLIALKMAVSDTLSDEEQVLYRLAVTEGRSWAEVGQITGLTTGAAKTKWWRARRRLVALIREGENVSD